MADSRQTSYLVNCQSLKEDITKWYAFTAFPGSRLHQTQSFEYMSFPPLNRNQAENEQFNTRQLQETADIGDDSYMVDSPDNSFAFDPQVFMEQLGIRPTEAEEHEPVQHHSEEDNRSGDASVDADDALSDDLTNALHLDTSAVPTTSIGIPESAATGSPHSSLRSRTMSLALPDNNENISAVTDELKTITINTTSIPPPDSMENEDSFPRNNAESSIQSASDRSTIQSHAGAENDKPSAQASSSSGGRRLSTSTQPSMIQKVVSKTRPAHLPPKQKEEDMKHNKEWEEMMHRSRMSEQARLTESRNRRLSRESAIEANTAQWERTVLPDWKKAIKDPEIQRLWWKGIPPKLRSVMWERAIGNPLALSKDAYSSCLSRAKSLLSSRRFPTTALSLIESDISTTLPQLHIFHRHYGPLYEDLYHLLCAWVIARADEGLGYVEGIAKIGGMLLLNLNGPNQAFMVMRNLLEKSCLRAFYGGHEARDDVEAYYRIFDTLLADTMPKVYFNFKQYQISPAEYLPDWIMPLFLNHLPIEACSRIWDVWFVEGDSFLFRTSLALLAAIESRLFFPDREELLAVLKGESRAALEIAKRELRSPSQVDQTYVIPRYDIYGLTEENMWERVMETTEWWKESTWQRLLLRELPDA